MPPSVPVFSAAFFRALPLEVSRWLLVVGVLAVAWPFGLVRAADQGWLALAVGVIGGLAGSGWILLGRWPQVPGKMVGLCGALLLFGWGVTLLPRSVYVPELGVLLPLDRGVPEWVPGTVDGTVGQLRMRLVTAFVVIFLVAADAGSSRWWRRRMAAALGLAAAAVGVFGLYQKSAGALNVYWREGPPGNPTFFGPFVYHGNAASFLLAGLPFCLGLGLYSLRQPGQGGRKLLWCLATLGTVTALLVNTSRAGVWLGAATVAVVMLVWFFRLWQGNDGTARTRLVVVGGVALAAVGLMGVAFGWDGAMARSSVDQVEAGLVDRMEAPKMAMPTVRDAGWTGFGPGTFRCVFPAYSLSADLTYEAQVWESLHNDPLQTVIEWGWLGGAGWAALLGMVAVQGWRQVRETRVDSMSRVVLEGAGLAFVIVLLHSMVDFPFQIPAIAVMLAVSAGLLGGRGVRERS